MNINNKQVLKKIKYISLTLILLSSETQASNWVEDGKIWAERHIQRPALRALEDMDKQNARDERPEVKNPILKGAQHFADYVEDSMISSKRYLEDKMVDPIEDFVRNFERSFKN